MKRRKNVIVPLTWFSSEYKRKPFKKRSYGKIVEGNRFITVRLWNTDIVTIDKKRRTVTLDSGGYMTKTTKRWMNEVMDMFGINVKVLQRARKWRVKFPSYRTEAVKGEIPFYDGIEFLF